MILYCILESKYFGLQGATIIIIPAGYANDGHDRILAGPGLLLQSLLSTEAPHPPGQI